MAKNHSFFILFFVTLIGLVGPIFSLHAGDNLKATDVPDAKSIIEELTKIQQNDTHFNIYDPTTKKRPAQCPIKSADNATLVTQLQELTKKLVGTSCAKDLGTNFSDLGNLSKGTSAGLLSLMGPEYYKVYGPQWGLPVTSGVITPPPTTTTAIVPVASPTISPAVMSMMSPTEITQVLSFVQNFAKQKECLNEIRLKNLIPLMASIITKVSQMALLVPSPQALGVALGGMGIGIGLTVLYAILESYKATDWSLYQERSDFVQLVCTFYDIRRQLADAQVLKINDGSLPELITKKQQELTLSKESLNLYQKKLIEFNEKVKLLQMEHLNVAPNWGGESSQLWNFLEESTKILGKTDYSPYAKIEELGQLSRAEGLRLLLENGPLLPTPLRYFYHNEFISFWNDIKRPSYFLELKDRPNAVSYIGDQVLSPLKVLNDSYFIQLSSIRNSLLKEWFETKITITTATATATSVEAPKDESNTTNKTIIENGAKSFFEIITFLENKNSRLTQSLAMMDSINKRKNLNTYDNGDMNTFDILEQFKLIQKNIYHDKGYPFIRYLVHDSVHQQNILIKHYDEFYTKVRRHTMHDMTERQHLCRLAYNLYVSWSKGQSATEVAYDFLQTNAAIIPPYGEWFKRFWIIPLPWPSYEIRLRWQLAAMNYAEKLARNNRSEDVGWWKHFMLNIYGYWNIGKNIEFSRKTEKSALKLEEFLLNPMNECTELLNQ